VLSIIFSFFWTRSYRNTTKDKFEVESNIEAFIFRIAKNKWINYVKKEGKTTSIKEDIAINMEPSSSQINNGNQIIINELLEKLGNVCKEILTYTIFYNLSMEDVVPTLGV